MQTGQVTPYSALPDGTVQAANSYLLAGLMPQPRLKIYPDSAHGFLFQYHAEFAADVTGFLS